MINRGFIKKLIVILTVSQITVQAAAGESEYKQQFMERVYQFAQLNRFNYMNVNRDKYVNCIMQVEIKTKINENGEVVAVEIIDPAPAPKVNRYFSYIIEQASPYDPLEQYIGLGKEELIVVEYFRLQLNLYENSKVTEPCV